MQTDARSTGNGTSTRNAPGRRTVATYSSYADAERAVDYLSDHDFPVERVAIIGQDIRFVEQVTGRVSLLDSALRGGVIGGITGLLIAWLFAVFSWFDPIVAWGWLILDALWFGFVVGALFGLLAHALTRGRRDFASIPQMQAQRYEVTVDEEVADRAEALIREMQGSPAPA
jgi:hypothetical protein